MAESLGCSPETITLLIDSTPIHIKVKKKEIKKCLPVKSQFYVMSFGGPVQYNTLPLQGAWV